MKSNFFLLLSVTILASCKPRQVQFVVPVIPEDQTSKIVDVQLPEDLGNNGQELFLADAEAAHRFPLQVYEPGRALFTLPSMQATASELSLQLIHENASSDNQGAVETNAQVQLSLQDKAILDYQVETACPGQDLPEYYCRSGFIHPLTSPSGKILTDDFPAGHTHQHAMFFAWTRTTFKGDTIDFWNQHGQTGDVRHKALLRTFSGLVFSGFQSELEHYSHKHGVILEENWDVRAGLVGDFKFIDIRSEQTNVTSDTLFLLKYHYGGLGVRGHKDWNSEEKSAFKSEAKFLTSEGKTKIEANHSKPHWTAMYGLIDDTVHGLAILDHPENKFHPQSIRVHPSMPYFCQAPIVEDGFHIAPGETYVSKYRIITFDGTPDAKALQALWQDYATPLRIVAN